MFDSKVCRAFRIVRVISSNRFRMALRGPMTLFATDMTFGAGRTNWRFVI